MTNEDLAGMFSSSSTTTTTTDTIYDLHINTLKLIEAEMARLHILIQREDGDVDVSQEQLGNLQNELIRLSNAFSDKECEDE